MKCRLQKFVFEIYIFFDLVDIFRVQSKLFCMITCSFTIVNVYPSDSVDGWGSSPDIIEFFQLT
jgi:hypothetical protein